MIIVPKPFLWVAFPGMLGGYPRIIELAQSLGFGGIAPRAGQGNPNGSFSASLYMKDVTAIRDAGLECLPWVFSRPQAMDNEIACAWRCQDAGASHFIIDAELPWDQRPNANGLALRYGDMLLPKIKIPVYDAPWPWINYHPGYPTSGFGWVAGRMIQSYWTEIGVSARKCLDTARAQWKGKDDRLLPIGITYGKKEMSKWGAKQLPPGEIELAETVAVSGEITGGWYSAEAAGVGILAAISPGTTETPPTQPETASTPLGWADRTEESDEHVTFYRRNHETHGSYDYSEVP